jgi:cytochrome c peroxidase
MVVRFRADFRVAGATTVKLALDVARVLRDVTIRAEDGSESTHSAEGDGLAVGLSAAVERAWFWLEAGASVGGEAKAERRVRDNAPYLGAKPLAFVVPAGFPQPMLPEDNVLTTEGVVLGEKLFFDVRLSGNGTQSCASCHAPERAFSDGVALSRGADGAAGVRNAMPLFNLAWAPNFAWDGSKPRVRDQALAAMVNPIEMHGEPAAVVAALARDGAMGEAFAAAFGSREITAERVGLALEQYLLTLVAADSKFDRSQRGAAELSEQEKEGFALFVTEYDPVRGKRGADCFHCHGGALFADFGFKNNGLDLVSADAGRAVVTGKVSDAGKFKTPPLRNVALTAPYMHDGRFATLEEVVAHYDHGVKRAATLDPNLAKHPDAGLGLTSAEQAALVAFLRTLTDARYERRSYSSPSQ